MKKYLKMSKKVEDAWSTVITPKKSWFNLHLREVWAYRDLVFIFVRRDIHNNINSALMHAPQSRNLHGLAVI